MAQADAHYRHSAQDLPHVAHNVVQQLRVPRPRRQQDARRIHGQHILGGSLRRYRDYLASTLLQQAQDVVLETHVGYQDAVLGFLAIRKSQRCRCWALHTPAIPFLGGNRPHQILVIVAGHFGQLGRRRFRIGGGNQPHHDAPFPQAAGDGPGVHPADARDALGLQVFVQGLVTLAVAGLVTMLPDYKPGDPYFGRLEVLGIDTVVAHKRISQGNQLTSIRRIGEHLLVTGHAGIEDHLAVALHPGAHGLAPVHRPVLQHQVSRNGTLAIGSCQCSEPLVFLG